MSYFMMGMMILQLSIDNSLVVGGTWISMVSTQLCKVKFKWQTLLLFNIRSCFNGDLCTLILLDWDTIGFWGTMALSLGVAMLPGLTFAMLLISTVVTDGLIQLMAPGLLFAMLVIFSFTFFIVNRVALLDPFGFGHWHFVLTAFLTLNFFYFTYLWYRH